MGCFCFGSFPASEKDPHQQGYSSGKNINLFSYDELRAATRNFHESSKIGRGGFGTVYKGTLKNRTEVAVKTLSAESKQGIQEFLTEIDTITNVKHPNLVELIGCCVQGSNRVLVYEYLEYNSLDRLLLGSKGKKADLDWSRRSAICMGAARGLAFLHEELDPPIVHRDIKASNILLDRDFVPKIGDFGLAKLFPDNVTHLSTRVAGTVGYLAPEYAMRGQLTKKADIYSFGVLMLEIVSGRSSAKSTWSGTQKFLLELTWELYEEGRLLEMVDSDLEQYPEEEVLRYMKIALFCTQSSAKRRPSMAQVVSMLSKRANLNEKLLTPPGIIHDVMQINRGSKPTNASRSETATSSMDPNSSAIDSTERPTSSPVSFTDMSPR
ncbi:putative serine/threonine-protein kinase [Magnolia sinica]|uniref:putative serine/threonine-protein kinase n=1 Tax=Magnolia sinica TaxID=86752 RepID=UPI0026598FF1|nr:putative serine/threonine-protein kinase [Magnolia sinica]